MGAEATGSEAQYAFDDVRVDPRSHRVFKAGQELALEPKAYGVLLELLRRAGDVVERDQLLDTVWGHRHVTPAVLNRIIALLRKALGDDAEHPRLIRTVHGVGYALIATIEAAAEAQSAEPAQGDELVSAQTPAAEPVVPPGRRSNAKAAGLLVAIAGAAVVAWMLRTPNEAVPTAQVAVAPQSAGAIPASEPATVVVLPLELRSTAGADRAVAVGLGDSLDEMLSRLSDVRVTARESARIAHERATDARAAGELLGVAYVLHGSIEPQAGESFAVELELLRTRDGAPVWTSAFQQPRDQLFRLMGPTLDGVQRILRPSAPAVGDPLIQASESAQDLYWMARRIAEGSEPDRRQRVIALLERAVERDPDFALAHCAAAENWRLLAVSGAIGLDEGIARAQTAVARALEIDPQLVCAHLASALIYTTQWRTPQAVPAVRRALELAPDDPRVLALAGNMATYQGRPREGLELHERAQQANPLGFQLPNMVWNDLMLLGRYDEVERNMAQLERDGGPRARAVSGGRIRSLVASGRYADAIAIGGDADTGPIAGIYTVVTLAQAYTQIGRVEEAEAELAGVDLSRSNNPLVTNVRMNLYWRSRRFAEARAWIEGIGAGAVQEPWRSSWRAQARALTGDPAGAAADYDAAFERDLEREIVAHSWYTIYFGINQLANWAVVRRELGLDAMTAADAYAKRLHAMIDGGTDIAAIDYCRAVESALRGDHDAAGGHLTRALERGWRDANAFDTDLVWREHAQAAWLQPHQQALAQALAAERAKYDARQLAP